MLAMVSVNLQAYHLQQKTAEKHLLAYAQLIEQLVTTHPETTLPTLPKGISVFTPKQPLSKHLLNKLNQPEAVVRLPQSTLAQLTGSIEKGNHVILVKKLSLRQPMTLVATTLPSRQMMRAFIHTGLFVSVAILGIMLFYGLLTRTHTLRRLQYISRTAEAIINGNSERRIPINPAIHDEYSRLSEMLNAVFDKNAQLMQELRQVNNNIAHDLKSPLNRMRSRMEVALLNSRQPEEYEQALTRSIADVDNLLKTFNALLLMGNLDAKARNFQLKPTSLTEIVDNLAELYELVAEEKQHVFEADIARDITVFANANLFAQAISNLLDNAIKYTPDGGHIEFSLQRQADTAMIIIADNGPGIPPEQRQAVFERFTRLDSARQLPGTGLGMSLVRAILQAHHASIQLHDNQSGLRVEIRLRCA